MKLLVCDVEGTLFQPHIKKDSEHPSYIWAGLAAHLGAEAEQEEKLTHQMWKNKEFGDPDYGEAYIKWVKKTIDIHKKHGLTKQGFDDVVKAAQYYDGCQEFFRRLNRKLYIPILISGGIKQFSSRACTELGVLEENSYAACSYFFFNGQIDSDLILVNTSNFYGKQEIVKIALRKYGLDKNDWIFIGDGGNDVSVAREAPISIGICPLPVLKEVVTHSYVDFIDLMADKDLMRHTDLLNDEPAPIESAAMVEDIRRYTKQRVDMQIGKLSISKMQERAVQRVSALCGDSDKRISGLRGVEQLLRAGEELLYFYSYQQKESKVVSAVLQPFSVATEIMINICDIYDRSDREIKEEKDTFVNLANKIKSLENIPPELFDVLYEFRELRNISAHNYKKIPIDAAYAITQRTYEIIQRLEFMYSSKC